LLTALNHLEKNNNNNNYLDLKIITKNKDYIYRKKSFWRGAFFFLELRQKEREKKY